MTSCESVIKRLRSDERSNEKGQLLHTTFIKYTCVNSDGDNKNYSVTYCTLFHILSRVKYPTCRKIGREHDMCKNILFLSYTLSPWSTGFRSRGKFDNRTEITLTKIKGLVLHEKP